MPRGRRTKLTPKVQERIINAVRAGLRYKEAAQVAGIDESTFYNWKKRGAQAKSGLYFEFYQALKRAEAEGEFALIARIQQEASNGTWQAAAWILERRHPERWGRRMTLAGDKDEPLRVIFAWEGDEDGEGEGE